MVPISVGTIPAASSPSVVPNSITNQPGDAPRRMVVIGVLICTLSVGCRFLPWNSFFPRTAEWYAWQITVILFPMALLGNAWLVRMPCAKLAMVNIFCVGICWYYFVPMKLFLPSE